MSELLKISPYGLVDGDNPLSDAPDGALEQAENVIISAQGVVTPVDGFEVTGETAAVAAIRQMNRHPDGTGWWVSSNSNCYNTNGVKLRSVGGGLDTNLGVVDAYTPRILHAHSDASPIIAAGLSGRLVTAASDYYTRERLPTPVTTVAPSAWTAGKWMSSGRAVAYRTTLFRRYANGLEVESPPSAPYIFRTHFYVTASGGGMGTLLFSRPHGLLVNDTVGDAPSGGLTSGTVATVNNTHKVTLSGSTLAAGSLEVFVGGATLTNPEVTALFPTWAEPNTSAPITRVRFYRTPSIGDPWGTPGTQYYLAGEVDIDFTLIGTSTHSATFTDAVTDDALTAGSPAPFGDLSLTDEGLRGLGLQSFPPRASDIALWDGRLWAGAPYEEYPLLVELLGTASTTTTNSLAPGDTFTASSGASIVFTAAAEGSPITVTGVSSDAVSFPVAYSGDADINLETTVYNIMEGFARSLAAAISWIYPVGSATPGGFFVRNPLFSGVFLENASGTFFNPTFDSDSILVQPRTKNNGVWPSVAGKLEVFDPADALAVGTESDIVLRIYPWRDRLFVFKATEGIFVVYGNGSSYSVAGPVNSAKLLATEAIASVGNELYAWTDIGVLRLTAGGSGDSISGDVDDFLNAHATPTLRNSGVTQKARLVGDELERTVTLWAPDENGKLTTGYVFNVDTGRWSIRTDVEVQCIVQDPTNSRVWASLGTSSPGTFSRPRAVDDPFRFSGPSSTASYTVSGDTITNGTTDMKAGDAFVQGANIGYVTANDGAGILTLAPGHGLTTGASRFYPAIPATVAFQPFYLQDPGTQKLVSNATVFMSPDSSGEPQMAFVSERAPDEVFTESEPDGYGMNSYGDGYYSGQFRAGVTFQANTRTGNVRAPSIVVRFCRAFSNWKFWGLGINLTKGLERPRG